MIAKQRLFARNCRLFELKKHSNMSVSLTTLLLASNEEKLIYEVCVSHLYTAERFACRHVCMCPSVQFQLLVLSSSGLSVDRYLYRFAQKKIMQEIQ